MKKFFITSTGTHQGKTLLTTALCWQWRQHGKIVAAIKPVISGFDDAENSDTAQILQSLDRSITAQNITEISPWRFAAPLSPDEAARQEGRRLELSELVEFCQRPRMVDVLLIEGAGGVMSPLTESATNLDLIMALGFPVVLVAASYLGCVSHILTALQVLNIQKVTVAAIVLMQVDAMAQPLAITKASLQPHLPQGVALIEVNHLASAAKMWKNAPNLTAWMATL